MSLATLDLPSDPDALRAFALACQAELKAAELSVQLRTLEIEKLKFQIAKLRRMQFGRSSERITRQIEQLELQLEELETGEAEDIAKANAEGRPAPIRERSKPKRKPLPEHLPREEVIHEPEHGGACICPACGGGMAKLGEDMTEVLDYVPGRFQVIRHIRPKYACKACDAITQAPAPAMLTPRGRATPAMLAHLLVSKYCDHLPLYRQSEIYAREGVDLDRSTLCDWVGQAAWLLGGMSSPPRRSTATIRRSRFWRRGSGGPRPGGSGSMSATTGPTRARRRRLPPISTARTAAASIPPITWRCSPAFFRPMAIPVTKRSMIRAGSSRARSPRWPVGHIAAGSSSMCGRPPSRRWPKRPSTVSPPYMRSRPRPASRRPMNASNTAPRPGGCLWLSSIGP
jgi:transposase